MKKITNYLLCFAQKRRLLGGLKALGRIFEGEKKRATKYERVESCPSPPPPPPGKWKGSWSKISKVGIGKPFLLQYYMVNYFFI